VSLALAANPDIAAGVEKDLRHLYSRAVALMRDNKDRVDALARELVERRHIGTEQFLEIMGENFDHGAEETSNG
ncbi:hypothetical protein SFRA_032875, partial [Streptomyces xinghaiensis]